MAIEADRIVSSWRDFRLRIECDHQAYGLRCRIVLEPITIPLNRPPDAFTDCERDTLHILFESQPHRLTKPKIIAAMAKANMIHGDRTVPDALASLAERGLIDKPRPGSRDGYGITALGIETMQNLRSGQ